MSLADVMLWGRRIGSVEWDLGRGVGVFQYTQDFAGSGIELSPIHMPLTTHPYTFPALPESFYGLPGLLSDSLPDKFGHRLIDAWLASQGRLPGSMNPVERLCYIGRRGMGALEFEPARDLAAGAGNEIEIAALVALANQVLSEREQLSCFVGSGNDETALQDILKVGTSAGGARAKALVAWNPGTGEFRSGQTKVPAGFSQWLLKFDGVSNNRDKELADPMGYGRIEYAYYLMALDAGIEMTESRLHDEGGRSHFMTLRFDRTAAGERLHMQSLAALQHFDYNDPASYSYEQAMQTIRRICRESQKDCEDQFARACFNVVARNQDDHVKNIAFLMNKSGHWSLSPAYDVTYAWNPGGPYTSRQQMSVNGKRDDFELRDFLQLARAGGIKLQRAKAIIQRVMAAVAKWPEFAARAGVEEDRVRKIRNAHRLQIDRGDGG